MIVKLKWETEGSTSTRWLSRIRELESEIQEIEVLADRAIAEVKADYQKQINELFLKKEALRHKVSKIQAVSGNAWEDMKAGTELSWEAFEESVKSRIKNIK